VAVLDADVRQQVIVRTSVVGVAANVVLAAFKAAVGFVSGSIAVTLDAVNNLSDALSSVVTIIGARLASKRPDREHPYGHGRTEYMSQLVVAAIVLYAGITSLVESAKKVIHPEAASYSAVSLLVIVVAIAAKLVLGRYVSRKGEEVNSGALVASGADASFDAILSGSVLASAVIYLASGISLEAFVGVVISVVIVKSGLEMIGDAVDQMLGARVSGELSRDIKGVVESVDGVEGAYDLLLHDYGPDRYLGSVHVEVPETMTAAQIDTLSRQIQERVYTQTGTILTTVGIYSSNEEGTRGSGIRQRVERIVMDHDGVLQFHGFYLDEKNKAMTFDIIVDFATDREAVWQQVVEDVRNVFPDYTVRVTLDADMSD